MTPAESLSWFSTMNIMTQAEFLILSLMLAGSLPGYK